MYNEWQIIIKLSEIYFLTYIYIYRKSILKIHMEMKIHKIINWKLFRI